MWVSVNGLFCCFNCRYLWLQSSNHPIADSKQCEIVDLKVDTLRRFTQIPRNNLLQFFVLFSFSLCLCTSRTNLFALCHQLSRCLINSFGFLYHWPTRRHWMKIKWFIWKRVHSKIRKINIFDSQYYSVWSMFMFNWIEDDCACVCAATATNRIVLFTCKHKFSEMDNFSSAPWLCYAPQLQFARSL